MNLRLVYLLLSLLMVTDAHAQAAKPPPAEFAGVPWTATMADARKVMDQMPNVRLAQDHGSTLLYEGGVLAGQATGYISFEFSGIKFHRGAAVFKPATDREKQFRELHDLLVAKYGPPTTSKRTDNLPLLIWRFPSTGLSPESYTITCEMTKETRLGQTTKLIYMREEASGAGASSKSNGL